jgi:RNA polymerase sigma factor (sigma-70 family)
MTTAAASLDLSDDVLSAQRGDPQAFGRLVDAARSTVSSIALATVRDVSWSEEVAQEVLIAAWRSLPRLRNPASFWPWLRQLTRNRARQHLRDRARYVRVHDPRAGDELLSAAIDPTDQADEDLISQEENAAVQAALSELPDETRELVVLYYREGQSLRHVARLLGIDEPAAKKRLQRARDRVRASVLERLGEVARRTAPGAAFTAAVLGAISAASPSTAAAAGLGMMGKLAGGSKLLAGLAGAVPGLLVGGAGVLLPLVGHVRRAIDARERRQMTLLAGTSLLALTVFCLSVKIAVSERAPWVMTAGYAVMQSAFVVLYGYCFPRVVRRRFEAERAADPTSARRHRRDRIWSIIGIFIGAVVGAVAMWQALGRIR